MSWEHTIYRVHTCRMPFSSLFSLRLAQLKESSHEGVVNLLKTTILAKGGASVPITLAARLVNAEDNSIRKTICVIDDNT